MVKSKKLIIILFIFWFIVYPVSIVADVLMYEQPQVRTIMDFKPTSVGDYFIKQNLIELV